MKDYCLVISLYVIVSLYCHLIVEANDHDGDDDEGGENDDGNYGN